MFFCKNGGRFNSCDYILRAGHRRGCDPGENCNKYSTDPSLIKHNWMNLYEYIQRL